MSRFWRRNEGLTMVEALVAAAILGIVSAPILGGFLVARSAQAEATGRIIAQSLARAVLEDVQKKAFANYDDMDLQPGSRDVTATYSGTYAGYRIQLEIQDSMTAGSTVVLKTVTATVTWTGTKQRVLAHRVATKMERRI